MTDILICLSIFYSLVVIFIDTNVDFNDNYYLHDECV